MHDLWSPTPGQVVLIETGPDGDGDVCLTGRVIDSNAGSTVTLDLGASSRMQMRSLDCIVSFFDPDALYRVGGRLNRRSEGTLADLMANAIERVQRRSVQRVRCCIPCTLGAYDDGDDSCVLGETIDLGPGGCRVSTNKPFPRELDPTVCLQFPNGESIITLARILEATIATDHWEYRLVFADLDEHEADRIARLTGLVAA
ncbi:MAG TPA: PilZ domain-containing protein [Acidimicrobiales bacterium]|nr:PilZ domain-containing protein [Acidimicrobiales bacterium]